MCLDNAKHFEGTEKQIVYKLAIVKGGVPVSPFNALNGMSYMEVCKYIPNETVSAKREYKDWNYHELTLQKITYGLHFFTDMTGVDKQWQFIMVSQEGSGYIWRGTQDEVYVVLRCEVEAEDVIAVGEFQVDDNGGIVKSLVAMKAKVVEVVKLLSKTGDVDGVTERFKRWEWMKAND